MKYFLQSASVSNKYGVKTHSIVTAECGRILLNEKHGDWEVGTEDASNFPKREISREEYKALHEEIFPHSSRNMREEFEELVRKFGTVICAEIEHSVKIGLKFNYSQKEYESFLDSLDFWYDNGYGSPNIGGTIWFQDDTWATCRDYDGAEYWEVYSIPEIPEHLR